MAKRNEDRYGRGGYRRDREHAHDRGYMERAGDEVRSWFGDDDAERRRHMDEQRDREHERRYGSSQRHYGSDWNRSDWNQQDRERSGGDRYRETGMGYRGVGASEYGTGFRSGGNQPYEYRGRDSQWDRTPEDWRHTSALEPTRYQDYDQRWSGVGGQDWRHDYDRDRHRDSDRYTTGTDRPSSNWSVDEGRTQFGSDRWGRGPKGYQRSDNRILEDVCDRLTYSDVDAGDIEVKVEGGEVTLSGHVRDRWDKRRAEDVAEEVSGVREVHNNIRVHREDRGLGQSDTSQTDQPGTVLGVNPTSSSHITNERPKAKT